MMKGLGTFAALAAMVLAVSALGACRPAEQGRILQYQKGVYLGSRDAPLDVATMKALRGRTASQAGIVAVPASGGGGMFEAVLDAEALRARARGQSYN